MKNELAAIILRETTTIGLRFYEAGRVVMARQLRKVRTQYGTIRVKESRYGNLVRVTPEYEDCRKAAEEHGVPLLKVIDEARRTAQKKTVNKG